MHELQETPFAHFSRLLAPHSPWQWVWKTAFWLGATNGTNFLIEMARGKLLAAEIIEHLAVTSAVSLPFLLLFQYILLRLNRLQDTLAHVATTDTLTGLPNRRAFMDRTSRLATCVDGVLVMLDIDHFKAVNDTHGHAAGDACLITAAQQIRKIIGSDDIVGRLGGEEFAIYLPGTRAQDASWVVDRLVEGFQTHHEGQTIRVTLSAGLTEMPVGAQLSRALVEADEALYAAKRAGRARALSFSEVVQEGAA